MEIKLLEKELDSLEAEFERVEKEYFKKMDAIREKMEKYSITYGFKID